MKMNVFDASSSSGLFWGYAPGMRRHAPLGSQNGPSSTQQRTAQLAKQKETIENPRKEQWKTKENKEIKGKPTNHNLKEGMRRGMRRIYERVFFYPFLAMVTTQIVYALAGV